MTSLAPLLTEPINAGTFTPTWLLRIRISPSWSVKPPPCGNQADKGGNHELLDIPAIQSQWNVEQPQQVIDILGLWGDASDNIPGVPGIGEKTAKKLIAQFGSIETLLASTDQLKGKQKENLENFADQALLSKKLATIILDVPIDVDWEDLVIGGRDDEQPKHYSPNLNSTPLANAYSAKTLLPAAGIVMLKRPSNRRASYDQPPAASFAPSPTPSTIISSSATVNELHSLVKKLSLADHFCFDLETTSLDPRSCDILGIAFAIDRPRGLLR